MQRSDCRELSQSNSPTHLVVLSFSAPCMSTQVDCQYLCDSTVCRCPLRATHDTNLGVLHHIRTAQQQRYKLVIGTRPALTHTQASNAIGTRGTQRRSCCQAQGIAFPDSSSSCWDCSQRRISIFDYMPRSMIATMLSRHCGHQVFVSRNSEGASKFLRKRSPFYAELHRISELATARRITDRQLACADESLHTIWRCMLRSASFDCSALLARTWHVFVYNGTP